MDDKTEATVIVCYKQSVARVIKLERECFNSQCINETTFNSLATAHKNINFYRKYVQVTDGITLTPNVLPLPSQLNDFTRPAYLSSLKDKYETPRRSKQT